ncbi:MAG: Cullin-3 [Peltula sp. TS41687]|nr:MAG: Cullin-3 [Peltula sp. TS41687]
MSFGVPQGLNSPFGDDADFDTIWNTLASALREIHTKNASILSFEELYRNAYKLVLRKQGDILYKRVKKFEETWLSEQVRSKLRALLSGSLLAGVTKAPVGQTDNERRVAGEKFLRGLNEAWEEHNLCMNMITDVLMYMERVYCLENHMPSIFTATMGIFRDCILRSPIDSNEGSPIVADLLSSVIMLHIQMERDGDVIDRHLIRSTIHMLEGLYETDAEEETEKLYLTSFERQFLDASSSFYRSEAERLLRESDAATLLRHTMRRFNEEKDRCQSTIALVTAPKIKKVIEEEVIRKHMRDVVNMEGSGLKYMFDNDRFDELKLLYDLIIRVDPKKVEICKAMIQRVTELGQDINKAADAATARPGATPANGEQGEQESSKAQVSNVLALQTTAAIKWVEDVLQLKSKCDAFSDRSFGADRDLQAALTKGFTGFVNAFPRNPEYISLFIDDNLKRGLKGKTETEADEVLDKAIVLLRYLRDKDLFEAYYKKHLSKRLLGGRSISNDVEKQMISKMKLELGNHFTQKMEGMFKDISVSEELSTGFKTHVSQLDGGETKKIDLGVYVLTNTFWPMEVVEGQLQHEEGVKASCRFPPEIEKVKNSFEHFYLSKHTGRKLTWQANGGSADIRAVFPAVPGKEGLLSKERKHELNVSTYAMVVLLLFNDVPAGKALTFDEIQAKTTIPQAELIRNLQSLAVALKTRILIKEPMSKDIKATDKFFFNESFISKFLKIKVGVVAGSNKVEGEKERKDTEKKNDEMRGGIIEAAVVRIMKGRKELTHQNLCSEVISQLASRFVPDINMLKKRIESLIEREYLERVEGAGAPSYKYLA